MRGLQKRALATGRSGSSTKPVRAFVLIQTLPGKVAQSGSGASFPLRALPRAADASRQSQNELDFT